MARRPIPKASESFRGFGLDGSTVGWGPVGWPCLLQQTITSNKKIQNSVYSPVLTKSGKDLYDTVYYFWTILLHLCIIVYSTLFLLSIRSLHAITRAHGWGKLAVQGRACIGRSSDNFVLFVQLFTLPIIQFEFGLCSGSPIVFVFFLLYFNTMDCEIPQIHYRSHDGSNHQGSCKSLNTSIMPLLHGRCPWLVA